MDRGEVESPLGDHFHRRLDIIGSCNRGSISSVEEEEPFSATHVALQGERPENGGMTPRAVPSVGPIAGWGNTDAVGTAVDCDRR
jgi:hypothetical protein